MTAAYFVITHGSRSPRSVLARLAIEEALQKLCPHTKVGGGCLEGQPQSLKAQMLSFAERLDPQEPIVGIPLFLLKGVHTQVDIPAQIPDDRWRLTPLLGAHPQMPGLLRDQYPPSGERILLGHGSNYPGAQAEFEHLAHSIGARPLTWSESQKTPDAAHVLPYFLAGGYILQKIKEHIPGLLPTPLVPDVVASMARDLVGMTN